MCIKWTIGIVDRFDTCNKVAVKFQFQLLLTTVENMFMYSIMYKANAIRSYNGVNLQTVNYAVKRVDVETKMRGHIFVLDTLSNSHKVS